MSIASERNPIDALAEEFFDRRRRGESPTVEEYAEKFPQWADEIRELLPALIMVEQAGQDAAEPHSQAAGQRAPIAADELPARRLGDFRIIRVVGRGGMGVVYEAEQESLARRVALKALSRQRQLDAHQKRRFQREARAAARLHHTNIVPVFGVGEQNGLHYYVMQFIHGQSLDDVLVELKRLAASRFHNDSSRAAANDSQSAESDQQSAAGERKAHDVSAADVAHSLLTGRFRRTVICESASDEPVSGAGRPCAVDQSGEHDEPRSPHSAAPPGETAVGRLSDTVTLSGSAVLPGQADAVPRATYWQSVARIGIQAAEGVEHAHRQGVLHRDVKPGNLLLDTTGTVWVTDFGLAKVSDQPNLTQTGDVVGTLRYMAPEVIEGHSDERSDVCSLGLTLYELLALRAAFEEMDRHRLLRRVMHESPPRLRRRNSEIPRDLATIVEKAIDRDPGGRYQSAGELAADLRRFLDDEPIQARRPRLWRRVARWTRRHKRILTASLVSAVLALCASAILIWQQRNEAIRQRDLARQESGRAERNFQKTLEAVKALTQVANEELEDTPHLSHVRQALLQRALAFHQGFLQKRSDDPKVQYESAVASISAGEIHTALDEHNRAESAFRGGIERLATLAKSDPGNADYVRELAKGRLLLGKLLMHTGRPREAENENQAALKLRRRLFAEHSSDEDAAHSLSRALAHSAALMRDTNRPGEAEALAREALSLEEKLVAAHPENADYREELAGICNLLAGLREDAGRRDEAEKYYRRAFRAAARVASARENRGLFLRAGVLHNLGRLYTDQGELNEAEQRLREALEVSKKLVQKFPAKFGYRRLLAMHYNSLGVALKDDNRVKEALDAYQQSIEILEKPARDYPRVPGYQSALAAALHNKADALLEDRSELDEARRLLEQAIDLEKNALELNPDQPVYRQFLTNHCVAYGVALRQAGAPEQAIAAFREAVSHQPDYAPAWRELGKALRDHGRLEQAITAFQRCAAINPNDPALYVSLGALLCDLKHDYDGAIAAFRRAIQLQPDHAVAHNNLGVALCKIGKLQEAIGEYRSAVQHDPQYSNAYNNLGRALLDTDRPHDAIAAFQRAVEVDPESVESRLNLGRALSNTGGLQEARRVFDDALSIAEGRMESSSEQRHYGELITAALKDYRRLAQRLGAAGHETDAVAVYRNAARLAGALLVDDPGNLELLTGRTYAVHNLAVCLVERKQLVEADAPARLAIELWEELIERKGADADLRHGLAGALNTRAELLYQRDQWSEAQQLLERAIDLQRLALQVDPDKPEYRRFFANHHVLLTLVLGRLGRAGQAAQKAAVVPDYSAERWKGCLRAAGVLVDCAIHSRAADHLAPERQRDAGSQYTAAIKALLDAAVHSTGPEPAARRRLAADLSKLAEQMAQQDMVPEIELLFRRALELYESLAAELPGDADVQARLAAAWQNVRRCIEKTRSGEQRLKEAAVSDRPPEAPRPAAISSKRKPEPATDSEAANTARPKTR